MLGRVRPQWQAKSLIQRVHKLLEVDPSSACQRLLNAAIHDLREKVVIAGLDIATEAAKQNKLPTVNGPEDIENYPTSKLIDLSYRMGLLSRSEWRRVSRCYEIRRDLEHEDDDYEAGVEDCVYIFSTCVDVILSRDPVQLVKVTDFKALIEQADPIVPDAVLLEDFRSAPQKRQEEILKFLVSCALNTKFADVVQQNSFTCISYLREHSQQSVLVTIGEYLQEKAGRQIDERMARVASAAGVFAYLRQSARKAFFESVLEHMVRATSHWSAYERHGEILRSFQDFGGLASCPIEVRRKIVKWMILTYIGTPGGRTQYGNIRNVYFSNTAVPLIEEIFKQASKLALPELLALKGDKDIERAKMTEHIERRYDRLRDIIDSD